MAHNKEIKQIFDLFLAEKNLLNSTFSQKVHIHTIKSEQVKQMFDSFKADPELKNQKLVSDNSSKLTSNTSNQISTIQASLYNNSFQPTQYNKNFNDTGQSHVQSENKSITPIKTIDLEIDNKVLIIKLFLYKSLFRKILVIIQQAQIQMKQN